jgi:small subunit ribosomal protein S13
MAYILDTEISSKKSIFFSLTKIYGLGRSQSRLICKKLGFSENMIMLDLTEIQLTELVQFISKSNLILTKDLKKYQSILLQQKVNIRCYKGLRIVRGLPVRGQRTHTNAKTCKRFRKGF